MRSVYECLRKPSAGRPMSVVLICDFALQIADAMAYLENRRIVHRSLAARNVLVFAKDKVCNYRQCTSVQGTEMIDHIAGLENAYVHATEDVRVLEV